MIINLVIFIICMYVLFESISVASESKGLVSYLDNLILRAKIYRTDDGLTIACKMFSQFIKECAPFCQVVRYVLNAAASVVVAKYPILEFKAYYLAQYGIHYTPPSFDQTILLLIAFTLMFNVWGRMVYRVVGERRRESREGFGVTA